MSENDNADRSDSRHDLVENDERANIATEAAATFTALQASFARSGSSHHPIFDKFEPEHVTQFLAQVHEQDTDEMRIRTSNRW